MTDAALVAQTTSQGYSAYAVQEATVTVRRGGVEAVFTGLGYEGLNALWADTGWTQDGVHAALACCPTVPALFHVGPPEDAVLEALLLAEGLVFYEEEPAMIAPTAAPAAPAVAGLTITQPSALDEFVAVWTGSRDPEFRRRLTRLRSLPAFEHLVGRLDSRAVATAAVFHGGSASEIQHVVTAPEYRRRGIGTAMTAATLDLCRSRGRDVAVLTSSPEGVHVYERLGFRRVGVVRRFLREAQA